MRTNYLSWDDTFIEIANIMAFRSKDPDRIVGVCITKNNKIISTGYNGLPLGFKDNKLLWTNNIKKSLVIHAEINAILNATQSLENSIMYTTLFPCSNCSKSIVQSKIKEIKFLEYFKPGSDDERLSKYILKKGNVKITHIDRY